MKFRKRISSCQLRVYPLLHYPNVPTSESGLGRISDLLTNLYEGNRVFSFAFGEIMKGQQVGYVRVSTNEQNTDRQLEGMQLDEVFTDKASGKDVKRPALEAMLKHVRKGDIVIVHSMDRLARNLDDLRRIVKGLTDRGVRVEFVKEVLVFTGDDSAMATLLLSMLGAVAEFERSLIKERQKEGIALAKARGAYSGRKHILSTEQVADLKERIKQGVPKAKVGRDFGISRETVYQYLRMSS
jgi:DNA invertase Pin-like site-specific DNA recombinase